MNVVVGGTAHLTCLGRAHLHAARHQVIAAAAAADAARDDVSHCMGQSPLNPLESAEQCSRKRVQLPKKKKSHVFLDFEKKFKNVKNVRTVSEAT